jgi:hypothetical protein
MVALLRFDPPAAPPAEPDPVTDRRSLTHGRNRARRALTGMRTRLAGRAGRRRPSVD